MSQRCHGESRGVQIPEGKKKGINPGDGVGSGSGPCLFSNNSIGAEAT